MWPPSINSVLSFFFNDTATTEIYTLSLHDALPIYRFPRPRCPSFRVGSDLRKSVDRKSTRLNSSHGSISYAVFCLKKKKTIINAMSQYNIDYYIIVLNTFTLYV